MATVELKMPKMGESVHEATIIRWLKNEGDAIQADESVLEIATDKVDSEVPSTAAGTLVKRLFNEGDVVQVGTAIAIIEAGGGSGEIKAATSSAPAPVSAPNLIAATTPASTPAPIATAAPSSISSSSNRFYSPLVKNIAQTEGISQNELDSIQGTGSEGRVTKKTFLLLLMLKIRHG